jgi:hypothetical protein
LSDVRKPPINEIFALHMPEELGKCRWCGEPTDELTPTTKKPRKWHASCEAVVRMLSRTDVLRWQVEQRDHGICAECGEDWSERYKIRPEFPKTVDDGQVHHFIENFPSSIWGDFRVMWNPVIYVSRWHVEHKVPLWKVAHLPAAQRIKYFLLDAVKTVCDECHAHKTRKESAERAKIKRRGKLSKRRSKKLQSRANGFPPKGSRPMKRKK